MRKKQQGLSLIELMISITIGLVLMTGVIQMFLGTRAAYSTQQAVSRVQETGRLANEFLARDIRMAGFMGCMSRNMNMTNTLNNAGSPLYDFTTGIEGIDVTGTVPAGYPTALPGTDLLVVRSADGNGVGLTQNNNGGQLFIDSSQVVASGCAGGTEMVGGLCINDIVVITDCQKARVFQATNINSSSGNVVHASTGTPGNADNNWGGSGQVPPNERFGAESEIIKVNTKFLYIANNAAGFPSLWLKVGNDPAQEMLEGVENMQLTYGFDTTGDNIPNEYRSASAVGTAWDQVSSVRVELLVQSIQDNALAEPQAYTYADTAVADPGDRRLRQVFINTIGIRSRLP